MGLVMRQEPGLSHTANSNDLHSLLNLDHARLERLFNELLSAFEADARMEIGPLWNTFDRELRTHLAFEEKYLLPKFLETDAPEALVLLREHDRIREKLMALSIGCGSSLHALWPGRGLRRRATRSRCAGGRAVLPLERRTHAGPLAA